MICIIDGLYQLWSALRRKFYPFNVEAFIFVVFPLPLGS